MLAVAHARELAGGSQRRLFEPAPAPTAGQLGLGLD